MRTPHMFTLFTKMVCLAYIGTPTPMEKLKKALLLLYFCELCYMKWHGSYIGELMKWIIVDKMDN